MSPEKGTNGGWLRWWLSRDCRDWEKSEGKKSTVGFLVVVMVTAMELDGGDRSSGEGHGFSISPFLLIGFPVFHLFAKTLFMVWVLNRESKPLGDHSEAATRVKVYLPKAAMFLLEMDIKQGDMKKEV